MFRFTLALVVATSLPLCALLPAQADAQTSSSNTQTSALMAQLSQLEQEIASLSGSGSASNTSSQAPAPAMSSSSGGVCPDLQNNLSLGSTGVDVSNLQAFLAGQGLFSASITGYFGSVTQTSVQEWQESHGVVAGGSATATGFGAVGPKTRAAIASSCGYAPQQSSCIPTQPPATEQCPTSWQPVAGANGCTMYYQCAIPLPGTASSTSSATATSSATQACPNPPKPICSGTVQPFQTNANGCVVSYECVL